MAQQKYERFLGTDACWHILPVGPFLVEHGVTAFCICKPDVEWDWKEHVNVVLHRPICRKEE